MSVVFRANAIVTALAAMFAILAMLTLTGCGQNGPLYLPVVPPMPKPLPPEQGSAPAPLPASAAHAAPASQ